jgi:hypothetical protein
MTAQRWRKKPVVIEAERFIGDNGTEIARWCGGRYRSEAKPSDPSDVAYWIDIPTLEGVMRADRGDYVIKGVQGEFYPCKPDIFAATYEQVTGPYSGDVDRGTGVREYGSIEQLVRDVEADD